MNLILQNQFVMSAKMNTAQMKGATLQHIAKSVLINIMEINERWLQFAYFSTKGDKIYKTALKFPFHTDLEIDQEFQLPILGQSYGFTCVAVETKSNQSDTVDKIYVIATTNQ